jgi:hypothetical protein
VYLSLPVDADRAELADIMSDLSNLVTKIDGFTAFWHGENIDVEAWS